MTELLAPLGFAETQSLEEADVVLLNTCHIRDKAVEKVYSDLGRIRDVKDPAQRCRQKNNRHRCRGALPRPKVPRSPRREPGVDIVVGPQSYHHLGALIARAAGEEGPRSSKRNSPSRTSLPSLPERAPAQHGNRFPDSAGRLRQVLHVLRCPLHPRRRVLSFGQ